MEKLVMFKNLGKKGNINIKSIIGNNKEWRKGKQV